MSSKADFSSALIFLAHEVQSLHSLAICCGGIPFADFYALKCISENKKTSPRFLTAALHLTKSGVTRITKRLEGKNLIQRMSAPGDDKRTCCLLVTQEGQNVLKEGLVRYEEYFNDLLSDTPETLQEQLRSAFSALAQLQKTKANS